MKQSAGSALVKNGDGDDVDDGDGDGDDDLLIVWLKIIDVGIVCFCSSSDRFRLDWDRVIIWPAAAEIEFLHSIVFNS